VAFTYLKVKSAKCLLFTSGGLGLGLVISVLVLRIWSCLHHCQLVGLAAPPQEPHPAICLHPRLSALQASFGSVLHQSSFLPMHRGLDKTLVMPIFEPKNASECRILYYKYTKNSAGRDPRTPAAEGETFVCTNPRAYLPDAGAPPLLLRWLRPELLTVIVSCLDR